MTAQHGEIKIGARVFRPDGSAEHVRQVLIAPTRRQVVGLVVDRGLLASDVVEPADGITAVNEDEVEIRGRATTLIRAPPFQPPLPVTPLFGNRGANHRARGR